jgi:antitoxin MazE
MKAQIVQIGNSQGIRIPKVLLEESRLAGDVELEVCSEGLLIKRTQKPRNDWEQRFKAVAEDDEASVDRVAGVFEAKEWQW